MTISLSLLDTQISARCAQVSNRDTHTDEVAVRMEDFSDSQQKLAMRHLVQPFDDSQKVVQHLPRMS